jgi:hypothetical protein
MEKIAMPAKTANYRLHPNRELFRAGSRNEAVQRICALSDAYSTLRAFALQARSEGRLYTARMGADATRELVAGFADRKPFAKVGA